MAKLKIGIDARMIEHSGIGTRILEILNHIPVNSKEFDFYLFGDPELLKKYNFKHVFTIVPYYAKIYSPQELFGHAYMSEMDLLDIPHFNVPLRYIRKCVVTIHDIIPFKLKKFHSSFAKQIYFRIIISAIKFLSKKVISVSEFTKRDLLGTFHFSSDSIIVIHNAIDHTLFKKKSSAALTAFKKKYSLPNEYLLTVGIGKEHKNILFLLENLISIWKSGESKLPLVLGGANGKVPKYLNSLAVKAGKNLIILPKLERVELPLLYQGASLFLYPSLYEGFGFPPLEAQSVGTPVLSSNASVMPEILENSVFYFDPKDNADFKEKFMVIVQSEKDRKKLVKLGLENVKRFEWEDGIQKIFNLYREVVK